MFYVYVLKSQMDGRFYIGSTQDVRERLRRHNEGRVKSTRPYRPYLLVYTEEFKSRGEAVLREKELKRRKSHQSINNLMRDKKSRSRG